MAHTTPSIPQSSLSFRQGYMDRMSTPDEQDTIVSELNDFFKSVGSHYLVQSFVHCPPYFYITTKDDSREPAPKTFSFAGQAVRLMTQKELVPTLAEDRPGIYGGPMIKFNDEEEAAEGLRNGTISPSELMRDFLRAFQASSSIPVTPVEWSGSYLRVWVQKEGDKEFGHWAQLQSVPARFKQLPCFYLESGTEIDEAQGRHRAQDVRSKSWFLHVDGSDTGSRC